MNDANDAPRWTPGEATKRGFAGYDRAQWEAWLALEDLYYARAGQFAQTRFPTPGRAFDQAGFEKWLDQFDHVWETEAQRDKWTRGLSRQDFAPGALQRFYEQVCAAATLQIGPTTDVEYWDV